jgi:hypothetical protein
MRQFFKWVVIALAALGILLSAGCPKKDTLKEAPEEGEEQPDPGPGIPKPGVR